MSHTPPFLSNRNINNMWDVIYDEEVFRFLEKDHQETIYKVFINNINGFYKADTTDSNIPLIELNKKYILLILNHLKETYVLPKKITIHQQQPVPLKELITYEDIQSDRKSKIESAYIHKQAEFNDMITLKPPQKPNFLDAAVPDRPIKEMDKILKEMQAQRNYDVVYPDVNVNTNMDMDMDQPPFKNKKMVSFVEEETKEIKEKEENATNISDESTLFSKLKRIEPTSLSLYEQISNLESMLEQACIQLASIKNSL